MTAITQRHKAIEKLNITPPPPQKKLKSYNKCPDSIRIDLNLKPGLTTKQRTVSHCLTCINDNIDAQLNTDEETVVWFKAKSQEELVPISTGYGCLAGG